MSNPFHEGELKIQKLTGEESIADRNGAIISNRIMGGALPFLAQQPMAVFASRDAQARLWSSILFGSRGFMKSTDGYIVEFDLSQISVQQQDPFWRNIQVDSAVGMLAIELASRRRIRINGDIIFTAENTLRLDVKESFPNCPKYITRRVIKTQSTTDPINIESDQGSQLAIAQKDLLSRADVLFIATAHPTRGADSSHRGGNPGFIEILNEKTLRIPDYSGNSMFNTFGNLAIEPQAGITVPDFEHGRILQLTGNAEVLFDEHLPLDTTGGTHRYLIFHVDEWVDRPLPANISSELLDRSPFNPKTPDVQP